MIFLSKIVTKKLFLSKIKLNKINDLYNIFNLNIYYKYFKKLFINKNPYNNFFNKITKNNINLYKIFFFFRIIDYLFSF